MTILLQLSMILLPVPSLFHGFFFMSVHSAPSNFTVNITFTLRSPLSVTESFTSASDKITGT
jgi:hypothetical protein